MKINFGEEEELFEEQPFKKSKEVFEYKFEEMNPY